LTNALGLTVTIDHRANGGGTLQVRYRTLEQLDDVVRRLESGPKAIENEWSAGAPRIRKL
jgi:ParB family chromosome partitioning protein